MKYTTTLTLADLSEGAGREKSTLTLADLSEGAGREKCQNLLS